MNVQDIIWKCVKDKVIQIWLNNNYADDVNKIMCHSIDNVVLQLFYNDSKMIINNLIWIEKDTMNYHMYGIDFG